MLKHNNNNIEFENLWGLVSSLANDFEWRINNLKNDFFYRLATEIKLNSLGTYGDFGDLEKQFGNEKENLKAIIIEIIKNQTAMNLDNEFRVNAKLATFICVARNFDINFDINDLFLIAGDYVNVLYQGQMNYILNNDKVKKLIYNYGPQMQNSNNQNSAQEYFDINKNSYELYNSKQNKINLDYDLDSQQEKSNLEDNFYLESNIYEGKNINELFNNMFVRVENDLKENKIKKGNANDFLYRLAMEGKVTLEDRKILDKDEVINQIKNIKMKIKYDIGGDDFTDKTKIAMFLCVAINFNINFDIHDIENLVNDQDLINRYPINEMLNNKKIKKIMSNKNEILKESSYTISINKNLFVKDEYKQKLAAALTDYFSARNNQDKATAIKDLKTEDIKKIVNFDKLSKNNFVDLFENKKRIIIDFIDLFKNVCVDKEISDLIEKIKNKINGLKDSKIFEVICKSVCQFFSDFGNRLSSFFSSLWRESDLGQQQPLKQKNKETILGEIKKLDEKIDSLVKIEIAKIKKFNSNDSRS